MLYDEGQGVVVGSFRANENDQFKHGVIALNESFADNYKLDIVSDLGKILKNQAMREEYKQELMGDVLSESFGDSYFDLVPSKLEQLFENSADHILLENAVGQMDPIVGLSMPILKKNFLACNSKDIMMTEVPTKPIVVASFERKFLKDTVGNKHYIPDIFYSKEYREVLEGSKGKAVSDKEYTLPNQEINLLTDSGGSLQFRDVLSADLTVAAVTVKVGESEEVVVTVDTRADYTSDVTFGFEVTATGADSTVVKDYFFGRVDWYTGVISASSAGGKITKVKFGGHLSNQNNTTSLELDRERENMKWQIPEGYRFNTGLTVEKLKDMKALFNIDVTADVISDMSEVITQAEDSDVLGYVDDMYTKWTGKSDLPFGYDKGFVREHEFDCTPPVQKMQSRSQWVESELKYDFDRFIDKLKETLREQKLMFVVYGHPNVVTLIQSRVNWIINDDARMGGIKLDYKFGVVTGSDSRIHVVSTLKSAESEGLRAIAYPTTTDIITFKHYKYSLNIENSYRNPNTPNIPNIMGTSRYLTTSVLPVQGKFLVKNYD